jgi:hypothetical protein
VPFSKLLQRFSEELLNQALSQGFSSLPHSSYLNFLLQNIKEQAVLTNPKEAT